MSPQAVAGSIAREITRADGEDIYSAIGHNLAVWKLLNHTSDSQLELDYNGDIAAIKELPGAFDGDIGFLKRVEHPTLSDIGPGSIKVLTAIQLIKQYQEAPQGKALDLNNYKLNDLEKIVADLNDRSNPLSIKIAALDILNGQKFFAGKSISGLPWAKLTKEQQDAALTAYYTIGEHAVTTDMQKNEFFPFTPGPKGGKVGPWVLFGNNYSNLNAVLMKGKSLGLSVAPMPLPKRPQKSPSVYTKHADTGAMLTSVQKLLNALPKSGNSAVTIAAAPNAVKVFSKALAPWPADGFLAEVNRRGGSYTALAKGRPESLINELHSASKSRTAISPWVVNIAGSTSSILSTFGSFGNHQPSLPSIAPKSRPEQDAVIHSSRLQNRDLKKTNGETNMNNSRSLGSTPTQTQADVKRALEVILNQQARLPPAGPTGFNSNLTPAWAGLKIPM